MDCKQIEHLYDLMADLIHESERDMVEKGFFICDRWDVEKLISGEVCTGKACSLTIEDCFPWETAGAFHTHPSGMNRLSVPDLESAHRHNMKFTCIGWGEGEKKKVRCSDVDTASIFGQPLEFYDKARDLRTRARKLLERLGMMEVTRPQHYRLLARESPEFAEINSALTSLLDSMESNPCEVELTGR